MPLCSVSSHSISILTSKRWRRRNFKLICSSVSISNDNQKSRVVYDSLRVLQWDKLCDSVASFARTSLGRERTLAQLWSINHTYQDSLKLLDETNAAIEMKKHGACSLVLTGIDLLLVKSAIQQVRRGLLLRPNEALAVVALLQFSNTLQLNLKATFKQDADWYTRFMPLTDMIMELVINRPLIKLILQVVDEDGFVKDSASPALKQSRDQVRKLEQKLYQLFDRLVRNEDNESFLLEVSNIDGRWCIKSRADQPTFEGLLLSSGSGIGSIVEPISAVPLNDELLTVRALVTKAEEDVLMNLTEKMQADLDHIEKILNTAIQLDVINARATYSLSFGGTCPSIFLPEDEEGSLTHEATTLAVSSIRREWAFYLPNAYHPLLLQQHKQNLQKARNDLKNATAEIRRRKLKGKSMTQKGETDINFSSLEKKVAALELAHPVPVDIFIAQKMRVLVITGPNTGGKTICLKTIALAAMMAKSGLYVISSESAQIPWFDSVFADIGDEQSLSQSLSTFSGHLKQISGILSQSTSQSLVLLDEVGAGTNPHEGAALGMSLLGAFAESGTLLTIATSHHGELKTLKYSNDAFENACMEFDEVNLRPTYKILWGVPGRSNAINIAERLGLHSVVVQNARQLYGAASEEINEVEVDGHMMEKLEERSILHALCDYRTIVGGYPHVRSQKRQFDSLTCKVIIDMERFKQEFQELLREGRHFLMLSRDLHEYLLITRREIMEHGRTQRRRKMQEISEAVAKACSLIHQRARQLHASATQPLQPAKAGKSQQAFTINFQQTTVENSDHLISSVKVIKQSSTVRRSELPKVGELVLVSSLAKKGTVLRVDPSKKEILVQVGNMKLKVKLTDIET